MGLSTLTAGGDFHPALRTSAARYERPFGIMASGGHGSKALTMGNPHVPMPPEPDCKRQNEQSRRPNRTRATRIRRARTRTPRIRFRFVLILIIMTREELWTSRALPVDGLRVRLRGFRKSHHLIPAGPGPRGLQFAATRQTSACRLAACVSTIVSEF